MAESNREWLRTWVEDKGKGLTPDQKERALDVAEAAFRGSTGVGDAAQVGVDAVKKTDSRKTR